MRSLTLSRPKLVRYDIHGRRIKHITKKQDFDYNKVGVIFGIVGLLFLPLFFGIFAIIFGTLAKRKGSKKNTALILGVFDIIWYLVILI